MTRAPRRAGKGAKGMALALLVAQTASPLAAGERIDLAKIDLCARVPGGEVAAALGAELAQAKRFNDPEGVVAKCVYFLAVPGAREPKVFAVEAFEAENFDEVRPYVEQPVHEIAGLGDGAWAYRDPDSHDRLRLYVWRRDVVTLDVTGDDEGEVRRVAALAIGKF